MKKALLTSLLGLVLSISVFAQKSFVGMSKKQVKDYWKTEVSTKYFDEGTYDDTGNEWFTICAECGSGSYFTSNPEFLATFNNGVCISNQYRIASSELSVYIARINKMGYKWNESRKGWVDATRKHLWKIEGSSQKGHTLTISTLTPVTSTSLKVAPIKPKPTIKQYRELGFTYTELINSMKAKGVIISDLEITSPTYTIDVLTHKTDTVITQFSIKNDKCYSVRYLYQNKDTGLKLLNKLKSDKTFKKSPYSDNVWDSLSENVTWQYLGEDEKEVSFVIRAKD